MAFQIPLAVGAPLLTRAFHWLMGPFMGALIYAAKTRIGLIVMSALVWLGINFSTMNLVIDPILDALRGFTTNSFGGNQYGQIMSQFAGILQVDRCITMIISAYVTRIALTKGRMFLWKRAAPGA